MDWGRKSLVDFNARKTQLVSFEHCHYFTNFYSTLFDEIAKIDSNILLLPKNEIVEVLLYGNSKYDLNQNSDIVNATINFLLKSQRFSGPLL